MVVPDLAPVHEGEVLAGKYRVDHVLGAGGMGVVVAATHLELGQRVAIKFLLPAALSVPGARERFTREARAAATLRSDHVARVVDVGTLDSGSPYMIMEFLDGCDLGQLLARQGPLRIDEAVGYVLQACDAVSEAHACGIIHRDLKPGNLFLTRKPNGAPHIKVLDFGISKSTNLGAERFSLTRTSDVMGSPIYMAPEQIRSARDVDVRTDIWALGVILYELLTGRVPFPAQNVPQLCAMVLEQEPVAVSTLRADVPFELAATIKRCLAKAPADRFSSVGELMRALFPFGPAPASFGLTRSRPPAGGLAQSAGASSVDPYAQPWGETLAGPPPPAAPPHVIAADAPGAASPSQGSARDLSGSVSSSRTLRDGASTSVRGKATRVALVAGVALMAASGLAGVRLWSWHARGPNAPASVAPSASNTVSEAPSRAVSQDTPVLAAASSATQPVSSDTPAVASTAPTRTVASPPSHSTRGATAAISAAATPTGVKTTAPAGDFLPDERK